MATTAITTTGLTELINQFGGFTTVLTRELRAAQIDARRLLITDLMHYPPPPPGSTYHRTGNLGRGWSAANATPVTNDTRLVIENAVDYADEVQGANQAAVHRDRWDTVEEIQQKRDPQIQALYAQAAQNAVNTLARQ